MTRTLEVAATTPLILACLLLLVAAPVVGAASVATAQPNETATPTPTPTPDGNETATNTTNTTDANVTAAGPTRQATLRIRQPRYVDDPVQTRTRDGQTIYLVHGNTHELRLAGVNQSEVRSAAVVGDVATVQRRSGFWLFDAGATDGSYEVVWTLENGTRLTATLSARETDVVHVERARYRDQQQDAANWSEWESLVLQLFGQDADVVAQTDAAAEFLRFKADPLGYVLSNPISILTLLFATPSGLFIVGIFAAIIFLTFAGVSRVANRWRRFSGDEASLEERQDEIETEQLQSMAEGDDLNNHLPFWTAQRWRDILGIDNVFDAFLTTAAPFMDTNLLRDRLRVMHADGYDAVISYASEPDGEPVVADIADVSVQPSDEQLTVDDDAERVPLDELPDAAVEWLVDEDTAGSETVENYNLPGGPAVGGGDDLSLAWDLDEVSNELLAAKESGVGTRQRAQEFAELLGHVAQSDLVDDSGRVDNIRVALNGMLRIHNVAADRHSLPMADFAREHMQYLLNTYQEDEQLEQSLEQARSGDFMNDFHPEEADD